MCGMHFFSIVLDLQLFLPVKLPNLAVNYPFKFRATLLSFLTTSSTMEHSFMFGPLHTHDNGRNVFYIHASSLNNRKTH